MAISDRGIRVLLEPLIEEPSGFDATSKGAAGVAVDSTKAEFAFESKSFAMAIRPSFYLFII